MMPSRGWHIARGNAPRLYQLQCRNLSSASRRTSQTSSQTLHLSRTRSRQWQTSKPILAASSQSIRFASTTSQPSGPVASAGSSATSTPVTSPPAEAASSTASNLDTITLDSIDLNTIPESIASIPEKIGYLSEIGLNYGYGPTSLLEWVIEHYHIYAGLPWWGSIAATAVTLRLLLLPLFLRSSDVLARQSALVSVTKPITQKMTIAQRAGKTQEVMQAYHELRAIRKRAGISFPAQFMPIIAQGIFGYCGFKLLRAASYLPVPAFKTDGFLWLSDLTIPDPYLILPVLMAGTMHLIVRMGGETGAANTMTPGMQKVLLWVMPGIILIATGFQPGAVCVWFASGGALGVIQAQALQRKSVREYLGLAPLYKPSKEENDKGFLAEMLEQRMSSANEKGPGPAKGASIPNIDVGGGGGGGGGKNAIFMKPTYQSPNLRRTSSTRTSSHPSPEGPIIDVSASSTSTTDSAKSSPAQFSPRTTTISTDEMVSPSGMPSAVPPKTESSSTGILGKASKVFKDGQNRAQAFVRDRAEQKEGERPGADARMKAREEDVFKRRAEEYEKRARRKAKDGGKRKP